MPDHTTLIEIFSRFSTDDACYNYFEKLRWPEGVYCPKCGKDRISKITSSSKKQTVRRLYECLNPECGHQFTATAGTIFHDTHLPIRKWFIAVALMCNAKKGVSAKQMERDLGVSYRTAWYLNHRIRKAMQQGEGLLTGTIETDETYVGGKYDRRRHRERYQKQPVMGLLQRGADTSASKIQAMPIPTNSRAVLVGIVNNRVSREAELVCTDELAAYSSLKGAYNHQTVNHIKLEYVSAADPRVHTNSIENFWSLFKRGLIGSFHRVSIKHLQRYLDEFTFRFNNRDQQGQMFALVVMLLLAGIAMPYETLVNSTEPATFSPPASDEPF
ncbi:MAG TPA: IS1595 family transposase [Bryobacteraceae bacterium]|nr:IS1595 family transposase [Bryobacteraceae bacterium]